ncbi:baseplate J/gp47 family protein [Acetatifactor muris]|uniref:baseplate J/gp47 family protein n=1 Tax=Acetatifactor muris TaxID=879566 RepID=UPI0023F4E1B2|nr:baseplate J/gp47 family protein [Acetatifactor muris]
MDFSAESILARMKAELKNEDTKLEGSFSIDNLQAVAEELARFSAMRIIPLMNTLTDKEDDMGTSGNERHYVRWAKEATDKNGKRIVGNAKVNTLRDGTGFVSIAILTQEAKPPTGEQIAIVQEYINAQRPVGADPVVSAAVGIEVTISCSVRKVSGYTGEVLQNIRKGLQDYFTSIAFQPGNPSLNYYTVSNIISTKTEGVSELDALTINGKQESLIAEYNKYFTLKEVLVNVIE